MAKRIPGDFLLIVALFAGLSILKIALSLPFKSPFVMPDEFYYLQMAGNALLGKLYVTSPYVVTLPPGYPLLLAPACLLPLDKAALYHVILAINAVLTSSIVFPAYFVLKKYCSRDIALPGSALVAALPAVNMYADIVFTENLFIPLFAFSLWLLLESFGSQKKAWQALAGPAVTLLYLTRSTGLAMIVALAAALAYTAANSGPYRALKEKWMLILSFLGTFLLWIAYTRFFGPSGNYSITGNPYSVEGSYAGLLVGALASVGAMADFAGLLVREADYLLLSMYLVVFLLCAYAFVRLYRDGEARKSPLAAAGVYAIVATAGLLAITLVFCYDNSVVNGDLFFGIFGRYLEPALPVLFIFGLIGADLLYKKGGGPGIKSLAIAYLASLAAIALTLPLYIKFPDNPSIFYLVSLKNRSTIAVYLFIALFLLAVAAAFYLSLRDARFRKVFLAGLIVSSVAISVPSYWLQLGLSNAVYASDGIGRYFLEAPPDGLPISMGPADLATLEGFVAFGRASMWSPEAITVAGPPFPGEYVISAKILPYDFIGETDGFKLYMTRPPAPNVTPDLPYTIHMGDGDGMITENFYGPEAIGGETFRWTKNASRVIIAYPKGAGDMRLDLAMGGTRPDAGPVPVTVKVNDEAVAVIEKPNGDQRYTLSVPERYLRERYQVLELDTPVWIPVVSGTQDARTLGVILRTITVSS